jgi:hypothetical protein
MTIGVTYRGNSAPVGRAWPAINPATGGRSCKGALSDLTLPAAASGHLA